MLRLNSVTSRLSQRGMFHLSRPKGTWGLAKINDVVKFISLEGDTVHLSVPVIAFNKTAAVTFGKKKASLILPMQDMDLKGLVEVRLPPYGAYYNQEPIQFTPTQLIAIAEAEGAELGQVETVTDSFYDAVLGTEYKKDRKKIPKTEKNFFPDQEQLLVSHLRPYNPDRREPNAVHLSMYRQMLDFVFGNNIVKDSKDKPTLFPRGGLTLVMKLLPVSDVGDPAATTLKVQAIYGLAVCNEGDLFNRRNGTRIAYQRMKAMEDRVMEGGVLRSVLNQDPLETLGGGFLQFYGTGAKIMTFHKDFLIRKPGQNFYQLKGPFFPKGRFLTLSILQDLLDKNKTDGSVTMDMLGLCIVSVLKFDLKGLMPTGHIDSFADFLTGDLSIPAPAEPAPAAPISVG